MTPCFEESSPPSLLSGIRNIDENGEILSVLSPSFSGYSKANSSKSEDRRGPRGGKGISPIGSVEGLCESTSRRRQRCSSSRVSPMSSSRPELFLPSIASRRVNLGNKLCPVGCHFEIAFRNFLPQNGKYRVEFRFDTDSIPAAHEKVIGGQI